jgi:hypothetical protein
MPRPAGAAVIVSCCEPLTKLGAVSVSVGVPVFVSPYQNVAELAPFGIVTVVTDAPNCEAPKLFPADELESVTTTLPVVMGVPLAVCRCTVIGPRFGVADVAPDTALLVMTRLPLLTVSVKVCVADGVTPLVAVRHSVYVPLVPAPGVPASVAVPLWLSVKVTPLGNALTEQPVKFALVIDVTVGEPVVVTVKVPAAPRVNVVLLALVKLGAVPAVDVWNVALTEVHALLTLNFAVTV